MNRIGKLLTIGVGLSLLAALVVVPVSAQDTNTKCCQGGTIIEGNFGGQDVASINPIIGNDTASNRVISLLFPTLLGADPKTGEFAPNQPGTITKTWDISADGKTYTLHLRDDLTWSDGTPITAADVVYSWKAIQAGAQGLNSAAATFIIDPTGKTGIADVQAPDPHTLVVTLNSGECTGLKTVAALTVVPSHVMPTDVSTLDDWSGNLNPPVTAGPFNFGEFRAGEQVSLVGNPNYKDPINGVVMPAGYIFKNVPDQNVLVEQFLAHQTNLIDTPPVGRRADIRASNAQVYTYPGNSWDYLAFNLADPNNPQSAFDANGKPIDQGHHPLFGDVRVRQAIAHAIDVDSIIKAAVFGEGTRMSSFVIPASWAYDSALPPISFDQKLASQMLTDAGWIDNDNDPSTPRVAKGAMYAPDGTAAEFTLYTNEGNTRRTAVGTLVQDELAQVGIKVDFQTIDFNTLLDLQNQQTFDAVILGWRQGYPDDPDPTQLFAPQSDVVGSGNDFTSYNNPQFNQLNTAAKTVPGCATADRAPIYKQMQQILQNDVPYVPLFAQNGMYAAGPDVQNFDPQPSNLTWNIDAWDVKSK